MLQDLAAAIRDYISLSDKLLLHGIRLGAITIEEAKQDTAEIAVWKERLERIEKSQVAA